MDINPLILACRHDDTDKVTELLSPRSDGRTLVNTVDANGYTPLMWASHNGNTKIMTQLVQAGANVRYVNVGANTALCVAVVRNHAAAVALLLDCKANANDVCKSNKYKGKRLTVLFIASLKGNNAMVTHLLRAGANPNTAVYNGQTPLMTASQQGYNDVVKQLLKFQANPNQSNEERGSALGATALFYAVNNEHQEVVESLVNAGANVNHADANGFTPLMIAIERHNAEALGYLLSKGADVNYALYNGKSPLMLAINRNNTDAIRQLVNAGADVEIRDSDVESESEPDVETFMSDDDNAELLPGLRL